MSVVAWHDVECGGYDADLELWGELASEADGPILDIGCGTGRVALHLARQGHLVTGLDLDPELVSAFNARARGLTAEATEGDARDFELGEEFALALAPMQLVQLLDGPRERVAFLRRVAAHLRPGGRLAVAIAEEVLAGDRSSDSGGAPLPDTREIDGLVYSSLPLATVVGPAEIVVHRLRQTVSPDGELLDEQNEIRLEALTADELERDGTSAGLRPAGRRQIPDTDAHVGSTVVLLERGA